MFNVDAVNNVQYMIVHHGPNYKNILIIIRKIIFSHITIVYRKFSTYRGNRYDTVRFILRWS